VDVPVKSFHVPNEGAEPRISNPNHFIAARRINGQDPDAQLCELGNLETALSKDQLKKLYKNPKDYYNKVALRYDELVKEGWALPVYRAMFLAEAARVTFWRAKVPRGAAPYKRGTLLGARAGQH
jgi:hypothetical protein